MTYSPYKSATVIPNMVSQINSLTLSIFSIDFGEECSQPRTVLPELQFDFMSGFCEILTPANEPT